MEGRLRNMNMGEFWVYSPDGGIEGIDTIKVRDGRFRYETELRTPATFVIVFPNYSEQPVFARPGKTVTVKGDASHMKEMSITGTGDNDDMTKLRMELNRMMPPEVPGAIESFIKENPESQAGPYLLQRYFLLDNSPDYKKAYELVGVMLKEQPDNGLLVKWQKDLKGLRNGVRQGKLPAFSATDIKGRNVSSSDLNGQTNVVTVWASWNYNSVETQRRLLKLKKTYGSKLGVVSICLDADVKECRRTLDRDSVAWKTVCDGKMWQSPIVGKLGIGNIPTNWLLDSKGVIKERNLGPQEMEEKVKKELGS